MRETELQGHTGANARASEQVTVFNSMGYPPKITRKDMAPRLVRLDGKTVYLVDARFEESDMFRKQM